MECLQCGKELKGRAKWCRDCYNSVPDRYTINSVPERSTKEDETLPKEGLTVATLQGLATEMDKRADLVPGTLSHYELNPTMYAKRTIPQVLNWGPWMNTEELMAAGKVANRVPIPGDWDYEGTQEATG